MLNVSALLQALISAVFSIVFQAISQGFFPRFHVNHTSDHVSLLATIYLCIHTLLQRSFIDAAVAFQHMQIWAHTGNGCKSLLNTCVPVQVFGQVYIPVVNYVLMGLKMIVVGVFQTSARLGNAYGTVTSSMLTTCSSSGIP